MKKETITGQIEKAVFNILKENPKGIRWSQLNKIILERNPKFHPKTINGTVWKLTQKYPEKIVKNNGIFSLIK